MKISLITVGKTDKDWVQQGLDIYLGRLKHYTNFSITEIPELKKVSAFTKEQIKQKEGELILKLVKSSDDLILLDERGKQYTSLEWAELIRNKSLGSGGSRDLVFVIGGAYGFSQDVYKRANSLFSLSKMTFSHQMVRTIFAEQLYRAFTIIKGEPYHHE